MSFCSPGGGRVEGEVSRLHRCADDEHEEDLEEHGEDLETSCHSLYR